jgi:hypothetical protein
MKKCFKMLILLIVFLIQNSAFSQENIDTLLKKKYEEQTIYFEGTDGTYIKNKKAKKLGLFSKKLKLEFDSCSAETKNTFIASVKNRKKGARLLLISGVFFIASFAVLVATPVGGLILVVALVPYTVGFSKINIANRLLSKAMWLRNRDVLLNN